MDWRFKESWTWKIKLCRSIQCLSKNLISKGLWQEALLVLFITKCWVLILLQEGFILWSSNWVLSSNDNIFFSSPCHFKVEVKLNFRILDNKWYHYFCIFAISLDCGNAINPNKIQRSTVFVEELKSYRTLIWSKTKRSK